MGEAVHILEEEDLWYYGYSVGNRNASGIFPKNFVHTRKCIIDRSGPTPVFIPDEPYVVHEITTILREWGAHWKNLYIVRRLIPNFIIRSASTLFGFQSNSKDFEQIKNQTYDLIKHRSKIISGTLPVDELKRVTKQVCSEIDMGNKLIGLDLIVRDRDGNLINPDETSTLQLYGHHKVTSERVKDRRDKVKNTTMSSALADHKEFPYKTAVQQYSHIFVVAVKNFTCKMSEDAELLMTLYDAKESKAITENYVVRWSRDGLMSDLDQMYNLRVMFTVSRGRTPKQRALIV